MGPVLQDTTNLPWTPRKGFYSNRKRNDFQSEKAGEKTQHLQSSARFHLGSWLIVKMLKKINKHPDMNSLMINNDDKKLCAVRERERTTLFTCRETLVGRGRMPEPEEEEALAPEAFISNFTTVQTVFWLCLLLFANDGHHSSIQHITAT